MDDSSVILPNKLKFRICLLVMFFIQYGFLYGQNADSLPEYKNNIRLNISAPVLYGSSIVPSYERVLNKKQSISIEAGIISTPDFDTITFERLGIQNQKEKMGFKAAIDYRFFLQNENKYPAPRGIYIGPFVSYYQFNTKAKYTFTDQDLISYYGDLDSRLQLYQGGFQLGYQFIVWKRMSIDLILLGPALTYYNVTLDLTGDLSSDSELLQDILDALVDLYPNVSELVNTGTISSSGRADFFAAGFRYSIHVGFLF